MTKLTVGLLNDSFPPTIDGVANTVVNYARYIHRNHGAAVVATPWYPKVQDDYPFEVVRYPSAYISKKLGYRAGYPFDPLVISHLERKNLDIIHTHCPFISTILARVLRFQIGVPVVFTYHTKFDIDIKSRVALNPVRSASIKFILSNISACDEVWVVSQGAGENLRSLGYKGDYLVMENGTDFPKGRSPQDQVDALSAQYGLSEDETVFLFVGRMRWYKGLRTAIDGLRIAKEYGCRFRMFFVGDDRDRPEIEAYVQECGLADQCVFTGAVHDREALRTYFSLANLFLFPSTYDTNGIVVKEAAACSCPSVLIRGSCAAEGIVDGETGILIEDNAQSMGEALIGACASWDKLQAIGENAAEHVYLSWEDAVARAYDRYQIVLENYERKTDETLPFNEIFYENVQRVRGDIALKAEQIRCTYRDRIKGTLSRILRTENGEETDSGLEPVADDEDIEYEISEFKLPDDAYYPDPAWQDARQ